MRCTRAWIKWFMTLMVGFGILINSTAQAATSSPDVQMNPIVLNQSETNGVPMVTSQSHPPQIVSQAAVVMDLTTGTIVYAKNPLASHYPASLTKMMTALIALDKGHLSDELTATKLATQQPPDKLYLVPGEQEPLGKLLNGMLLNSANDAAVVIAQHYGGSISGFAKLMNEKAAVLGANHTHFDNPTGLQNATHVTTAYDLSLIAQAAMQNPVFRQIVAKQHFSWEGEQWHRNLVNINSMLFTYPGAVGIKTGYTNAAHETLAVAATHGHQTFLAILLDAPLAREINDDAAKLLNYAFANYETQTVVTQGVDVGTDILSDGRSVPVFTTRPILATVRKGHPVQWQQKLVFHKNPGNSSGGERAVGRLEVTQDGTLVSSEPVVATLPKATDAQTRRRHLGWLDKTLVAILGSGLILIILRIVRRHRRLKRSRRWA